MKESEKLLKKLNKEYPIEEMVRFSELDLEEKLRQNPAMIVRFRDLFHKELNALDELNDLLEKLKGLRYKHYRFETDEEWTKPEIEKYCLPSDPKILQMKNIIRRQEVKVRFFEMCWKAFEKQSWSMKSFIDTLKAF